MPVASQLMKCLLKLELQTRVRMRMELAWFLFDKDENYPPALFVIMRSAGRVGKIVTYLRFERFSRWTKQSKNGDTQSLLYLLNSREVTQILGSSMEMRLSGVIKRAMEGTGMNENKACCVDNRVRQDCLSQWRYWNQLSNHSVPVLNSTSLSNLHSEHILSARCVRGLIRFVFGFFGQNESQRMYEPLKVG